MKNIIKDKLVAIFLGLVWVVFVITIIITQQQSMKQQYIKVTVDQCEYIQDNSSYVPLVHAGDCKNHK